MFRVRLVILTFWVIGLGACKQIPYKAPPPDQNGSYFPQTFGSTWQYRDSVYGLPTDTAPIKGVKVDIVSYTMNGLTTDFNSVICYNQAVSSQLYGSATAYNFYFQRKFGVVVTSPPWGTLMLQILVDTAGQGYKWASYPELYGTLNGSPVQTVNTVVEKNISRVVNGRIYDDVIHTQCNFQINQNNTGFRNIALFDFYLAPAIGIIEKDAQYYGYLNETETLLSYSIK